MERAGAIALIALVPGLLVGAGCLADLERRVLETGWQADGTLYQGPTGELAGQPVLAVVEGPLSIGEGLVVSLTGIEAELRLPNETVALTPVSLSLGGESVPPQEIGDQDPRLSDGLEVEVALLAAPETGGEIPAAPNATLAVDLQWSYREGDLFDAGRFSFEGDLTPVDGAPLGLGAVERDEGSVQSIVFSAIGLDIVEGPAQLTVHRVTSNGLEAHATVNATLVPGVGVVRASLDEAVAVPEGQGYLLFHLGGASSGVATLAFEPGEDAVPAAPVVLVLALLALSAVARRRMHARRP